MAHKLATIASGLLALGLCGCDSVNSETKIVNTGTEPVPVTIVGRQPAPATQPGLQRVVVANFPDRTEVKLPSFLHKDEVIQIVTDDPNGAIGGVGNGAVLHIYYIIAVQGTWVQMMPKGGVLNGLAGQWIPANAVWINVATFPGVYRDLGPG